MIAINAIIMMREVWMSPGIMMAIEAETRDRMPAKKIGNWYTRSCFTEMENIIMITPTARARMPKRGMSRSRNMGVQKKASTPDKKMIMPIMEICHHRTGVSDMSTEGKFI
jgi:hypothetical protein